MFLGGGEQGGDKDDIVDDSDGGDSNADANNELSGGAVESEAPQEPALSAAVQDPLATTALDVQAATQPRFEKDAEGKWPLEVLKGVTILAIDDDPVNLRLIPRVIGKHCPKVLTLDGIALTEEKILESIMPLKDGDIVVTDYVMKGLNGVQVAEIIYKARGGRIIVFMMSGGGEHLYKGDNLEGEVAGPLLEGQEGKASVLSGFIQKPFTPDQLLQPLANARGEWLETQKTQTE